MRSTRRLRKLELALMAIALMAFSSVACRAQVALLMEEPYGFFGYLNPTGHNAIYFERICAETPVKLRRCQAGEQGSVISRYQGIKGYDWIVMPLVPYLYSVEDVTAVPARANRETVHQLRSRYHKAHLLNLGDELPSGGFTRGGWTELVGVSYERRIYAFRFETTEKQDDEFIALMNDGPNHSHFHLLFNNCSDFARILLNFYFPGTFGRSVFPDAGMTAPTQIVYKLERYARKHPETHLTILEIPQIPGRRRLSHSNKGIAESFSTTAYVIPIALINPYLAGGLFVDYLVIGRHHLIPKHPPILAPDNLFALTAPGRSAENPSSAGAQVPGAAVGGSAETNAAATANSGLTENKVAHEQILSAESQKPRPN
ncbi:MAG TPA: hypothetical protein VKF63_07195 [Terracidiphilus sp.]|nr:hypothetical protein [Terracidiphilus sp.]